MIEFRDYQIEIANKALEILSKYKIVYLAMQVRTGKTLTSLKIAKLYNAKKVLFLTKKKAIESIQNDYNSTGFKYDIVIINNESLHKITDTDFDLIISDEHHRNGAFPKPNTSTKLIKEKFSSKPFIFLSGTPTPESFSQWYHQFWVSNYTPFKDYNNFYKWAYDFVNIKLKYLGYAQVKDYSQAYEDRIKKHIDKYVISFTQEESGFKTNVKENVLYVEMKKQTYEICNTLLKHNVVNGKNDLIIADTGAKLMNKLHQIYSGTCILESGNTIILDTSKIDFIFDKFKNNKIAIFYKFKAELDLIKQKYNDSVCFDLETFNTTNKNIALQIVSGREGISLKKADYLVYINIDYSAVSYWQSRDRLTTIDRKENDIFFVFAKDGIEEKIYKTVLNKKNYTLNIFKNNYENRTANSK